MADDQKQVRVMKTLQFQRATISLNCINQKLDDVKEVGYTEI